MKPLRVWQRARALARLAAEGLVVAEEYEGYRVSPISLDEFDDLTQTRIEIEALALERSLKLGDLEWELLVMAEFRRVDAEPVFTAAGTPSDAWAACHARFHTALVSACGSNWLLKLRHTLFEQSERYRYLTVSSADEAAIRDEHQRLTDAVLARDVEIVLSILRGHLAKTRDSVRRFMKTGDDEAAHKFSDTATD